MKNTLFIVCMLLFVGCKQNNNPNQIETIDISQMEKKELAETAFTILPLPQYIALTTTDDRMQISTIDKIKIIRDHIYVADNSAKKLIIFDMKGNAIKSIGTKGHGPGEYLGINDFEVDNDGNILLWDAQVKQMNHYTAEGQFIKSEKLPFDMEVFQSLNNGNFLCGLSSTNTGACKGDHIILVDKNFKPINTLVKYGKAVDDNFHLSSFGFYTANDLIFYHKPINDNVYTFSSDGKPNKIYHFNFGTNTVPDQDKTNIENKLDNEYRHYTTLTYFTIATPNKVFGSFFDQGEFKQFVIDRSSQTIYTKSDETIDQYGHFISYQGSTLISYTPQIFGNDIPENFPEDLKTALSQGDHIICLYNLKK